MIGGSSPDGSWEFFSSPPCTHRLWGPPSLLSNGYQGFFPWGVRMPEREADHSPKSSVEVENAWSYISTPQYVFMAWCLVKHGDNFTFYWTLGLCLNSTECSHHVGDWLLSELYFRLVTGLTWLCPYTLHDQTLSEREYRGVLMFRASRYFNYACCETSP